MRKIGIIGGSGLEDMDVIGEIKKMSVTTPYGSVDLKIAQMQGNELVILSRHGREHTIPPSQVNFRANVHALKEYGCDFVLATTAVGSLQERMKPGDLVILDQFIDFTKHRFSTFYESFEPHKPVHTAMADPFSEDLRQKLISSCQNLGFSFHERGTVVTIEGPRFSTRAESHMFRSWGADVINMSTAPEAILCNEAGLPYAAVAMSTDYDCWKDDEEPVSWEKVLQVFNENVKKVTNLLFTTISSLQDEQGSVVETNNSQNNLKDKIRTIPNWPKPGVMFRDVTTLLKDPDGFRQALDQLVDRYKNQYIEKIVGIESRGFIIGAALADRLGIGFVPIRKKGKLPANVFDEEYELEYGRDKIEMHTDAIAQNEKVLLVDDLIATGGTALAACNLIRKAGGQIVECAFLIDLPDLQGNKKLLAQGYKTFSLMEFEGE